jgi:hypothetical protein
MAMEFKLKGVTEAQAPDKVQFHARALRAIGQDLSDLFPESLEITLHGNNFLVNGRYVPRSADGKGSQKSIDLLDKLRQKFLREQPIAPARERATEPVNFNRTYTPADIDRIDESGAGRRSNTENVPDIYSLGEILRMVGRIVDSGGGRLVELSRDKYGVTFESEDSNGRLQKSEFSSLQLYKLQQQYHAERGTYIPIHKWDGWV